MSDQDALAIEIVDESKAALEQFEGIVDDLEGPVD